MIQEIKLPALGENIHTADVVKVLVSPGDSIQKDQSIVELETEKSVFEVPSPISGTVKEIIVQAGKKIRVGDLLLKIETERKESISSEDVIPAKAGIPQVNSGDSRLRGNDKQKTNKSVQAENISTSPIVRKIAREMGIDLSQIRGSGPNGRILTEDLIQAGTPEIHQAAPLPDFSKWGKIEIKPMTNVRLKTAEHVSRSWTFIPHVTQFDEVDITNLEEFRKKSAKEIEAKGGKLTPTVIFLKLVASTLKEFPQLNASVNLEKEEIIYKNYFHIGIAVDTDRGLLAPVIRNVDQKSIPELAVELKEVSEKTRNKKLTPEEMQGGTFTITNLGSIAGTHFTPIINWPEVAILGIGRSRVEMVWIEEKSEPRMILPLSLSYDHRLVDGADAARFLKRLNELIQKPFSIET